MADDNDFWGKGTGGGGSTPPPPPSSPPPSPPGGEGDFWSSAKTPGGTPRKDSGLKATPKLDTQDFWGKGGGESALPAPSAQDDPWGSVKAKRDRDAADAEALRKDPDLKKKRRRRIIKRVVWSTLGVILLLVAGAIIFAPQIGSALAPGIIQKQAGKQISGTLTVGKVALSWGGPQTVEGLVLAGADGKEIAKANVECTAGLWGLATGNLDLGTVTVTGARVDVVRDAAGDLNIQKAVAGPPDAKPPSKSEPRLPEGLKVRLVVKSLQATVADRSRGAADGALTATLRDVDLTADVAAGTPLKLDLAAEVHPGFLTSRPTAPGGELKLTAKVDKWSRADGLIEFDRAKGQAELVATGIPMELIDALIGPVAAGGAPVSLRTALGPTLTMTVKANGDGKDATADLSAAFANASAIGAVRYTGTSVVGTAPLVVTAKGETMRAFVPALAGALSSQGPARIDAVPDATLTIETLTLPIAKSRAGGQDLRGAAAKLVLRLGEVTGRVSLDPNQPPQPFRVAPLEARVETADLAGPVRITAATTATLAGNPAGEIAVDVTASGLLDAAGALIAAMPSTMQGSASVKKIATAIAQPFVESAGLNLPSDVGPTLDIELAASTDLRTATPGIAPPTNLDLSVKGEKLTVVAAVELAAAALRSRGEGVRIESQSAGAIASRLVAPTSGWRIAPAGLAGGRATVLLKSFNVPRDGKTGAYKVDQAALGADISLGGLTLTALAPDGTPPPGTTPVDVRTFETTLTLKPGGDAGLRLAATGEHAGTPFDATGAFDVKGVLTVTPGVNGAPSTTAMTAPMALRPSGKLEVRGLSPTLAGLFVPRRIGEGEAALDLPALIAESLGGAANVTVETKPVVNDREAVDVAINVKAPRFAADAGAVITKTAASLRGTTLATTLAPATLDTLLRAYAPALAGQRGAGGGGVRLAGPARIELGIEPIQVPLTADSRPSLETMGTARVRVGLPGQTLIDGLAVQNEDGTSRALGRVGVEDLTLRASIPVASLVGPALPEERQAQITFTGNILGGENKTILRLEGELLAELSRGKVAGGLSSTMHLTQVNTGAVERLAGQDGLLTGLLGGTAALDATVTIAPPAGGFAAGAGLASGDVDASVSIKAPRLTSDAPVQLALTKDRINLKQPAKITLNPDIDAVNKMLAAMGADKKAPAGRAGEQKQNLTLVECGSVSLTLGKFSTPRVIRGIGAAPAKPAAPVGPATPATPAKADIAIALLVPSARLRSADGQNISLSQASITIGTEPGRPDAGARGGAGPDVTFKLDVGEAVVGENPPATGMNLEGRITRLFARDGAIDLSEAVVTVRGDMPAVPTAIADALMNQDGALVEALGPVVALNLTADRLPLAAGTTRAGDPPIIEFLAKSARATASFRGTVNGDVYTSERPLEITIVELLPALSARYIGVLPLLGVVEKTKADAAALVTATGLTVPLGSKDMTLLNADITADPGECRFQTGGTFSAILKAINQKPAGTAGARLEPLRVTVRKGVASYAKWKVPLGEFSVETEGYANLTGSPVTVSTPYGDETIGARELNVVTWIPLGAITEQAAGAFNSGLSSFLGKTPGLDAATQVPFRTKGPMNSPNTSPDLELFGKNVVKQMNPEDLIKKGLGDLLKKQIPKPGLPGIGLPGIPK